MAVHTVIGTKKECATHVRQFTQMRIKTPAKEILDADGTRLADVATRDYYVTK